MCGYGGVGSRGVGVGAVYSIVSRLIRKSAAVILELGLPYDRSVTKALAVSFSFFDNFVN